MDYALNPYSGCEHGCIYCYAPGFVHANLSEWRVVKVKRNIPNRLAKELPSVDGIIGIGTVTDPYQYAERKFMLTRSCLEVIRDRHREIHMHTKSDLIIRDIPILQDIKGKTGITITTLDDRISKITEPGAPLPSARLRTLSELVSADVCCYALLAPVMSTLNGHEKEMMEALADTGVSVVYLDPLNTRHVDTSRLDRMGITSSKMAVDRLVEEGRKLGLDMFPVFD